MHAKLFERIDVIAQTPMLVLEPVVRIPQVQVTYSLVIALISASLLGLMAVDMRDNAKMVRGTEQVNSILQTGKST
jgi:hypothetical protein